MIAWYKNAWKGEIFQSFFQGATQPNFASAAIMLGTVFACLVAFILLVDDKLLAGGAYHYVLDNNLDSQTYATHQLLAAEPSEDPSVLIFGSSVMLRCVKDRTTMAGLIEAQTNERPLVYNLSTDAQTSWEFEAMIDRFPAGGRGVVVLGASYGFWTYSQNDLEELIQSPKLGFPTPTIDASAGGMGIDVPFRTGIYSLDSAKYFLAHRWAIVKNLIRRGRYYGDPLDAYWMPLVNNQTYWDGEIAKLPDLTQAVDDNMEMNLTVVTRAIERLKEKGDYSVILYEAPINPGWFEMEEGLAFFDRINQSLQELATEQGITFATARQDTALERSDFVDYEGHIGNDEARMACTRAVADKVSEVLAP